MNLSIFFLIILAVRLAALYFVKSYFVADEYWQSLEVAHRFVFGYGYLTWEWKEGIRSYLYPMCFAAVYKLLAIIGIDTVTMLIMIPRIMQALLSAYADWRFFIWSGKKKWSLYFLLSSWFMFYICSRTLSNTLETSLMIIALSHFPWYNENTGYIFLSLLTCFLRPTAVVIWCPLWLYHLKRTRLSITKLITLRFVTYGVIVFIIGILFDSLIRGEFIVTPYEFLKFNIFRNIGTHYGSSPWHWYLTVGVPFSMGPAFIVFIFATIQTLRNPNIYPTRVCILSTIGFALLVLSFVDHKEFRFVAPLVPLAMYVCGDVMARYSSKVKKGILWVIAILILIGNIIPAVYFGLVHQIPQMAIMKPLQQVAKNYRSANDNRASILFLMSCHSTPYYSHIHENVTMRFLTCEPNLKGVDNYLDEAEIFEKSPVHWIYSNVPSYPRTAMPSHVVVNKYTVPKIGEFLKNYRRRYEHIGAVYEVLKYIQNLLELWNFKDIIVEYFSQLPDNNHIIIYERIEEDNVFNRVDESELLELKY